MEQTTVESQEPEEEELFSFEPGYEERMRKREELLRERRAARRRAQEIKRRIVLGLMGAFFLALLVLLFFFIFREGFEKDPGDKDNGTLTSEGPTADVGLPGAETPAGSGDPGQEGSADPAGSDALSGPEGEDSENDDNASVRSASGGYLGQPASESSGTVTVGDGIELYAGYDVDHNTSPLPFKEEGIYSTHGILIDGRNGKVIRSTDGAAKIYPASMTKIMTVYTAARHLSEEQLEDKVTITIEETDFVFR
ncbi:MAG: hypothetical protein K6F53_12370, partial [Lachnospiraceae bacterium]|nr:hypothetical protein [Lachnospiraceae bacterium]